MITPAASGAPPGLEGGWLGGIERRSRAHGRVIDVLFALTLAAMLGSLTISTMQGIDLPASGLVSAGVAFGVLHVVVAIRRNAPAAAYVLASLAMLMVVVVPNAHTTDASTGRPVEVPMWFMPSSLVFLVVLYSVAAGPPGRLSALVLPIALVGVVLAAIRAASALQEVYPGGWWVPLYLAAGLVITVLATWGLGSFQLIRRRLSAAERAEATRLAVREERSRIARDMHDVVAHSLAVIVRQAEGGAFAAARAPDQAAQALRVIADTGRDALDDMRGLLGVLRNPAGESATGSTTESAATAPSLADLPELLERVRETGLDVDCVRQATPYEAGPATELAAYRVVQEALTNTIKHAGRDARVRVRLAWSADGLVVDVTDDGGVGGGKGEQERAEGGPAVGEHVSVPGAGAGLQGLGERVVAVGGTFTSGRLDTGFQVRAIFPRRHAGRHIGGTR